MSQDPTKETTGDHDSSPPGDGSSDQNSPQANNNATQSPTASQTASQPSTSESPKADDQPTATPSTVTRQPSDPLCAICLDPITDRTVAEPCLHEFCRRCIDSSLQTTNRCPTCRQRIERILFNFRSALDYDQREVEEVISNDQRTHQVSENGRAYRQLRRHLPDDNVDVNDPRYRQRFVEIVQMYQRRYEALNARNLVISVRNNREHPENDAQLRQHLIENPREFVTVNVGQDNEYLLPAYTIGRFIIVTVILTDSRGVYQVQQNEDEHSEYRVRFLQPNQMHVFMHLSYGVDEDERFNGFNRLVSFDRVGSAIHELTNQRNRYEIQPQQRQLRLPQQQQARVQLHQLFESDASGGRGEQNDETNVSDSRVVDEPDDYQTERQE